MALWTTIQNACATQVKNQHDRGERIVGAVTTKTCQLVGKTIKGAKFAAYTGIGLIGTAALVGIGTVGGIYQTVRHPVQTAQAIKNVFARISKGISDATKEKILALEAKMVDKTFEKGRARVDALGSALTPRQRHQIILGYRDTLRAQLLKMKDSLEKCSALTAPAQLVVASFIVGKSWLYSRRCAGTLSAVCNHIGRYGASYPNECKTFVESYVSKILDSKLTLRESLSVRAEIAAHSIKFMVGECFTGLGNFVKRFGSDPIQRLARASRGQTPSGGAAA